ncbi:hypothetical protein [Komagataeibacter rhaeticus]|uniref:Uncharacterized protein n=1 Tax=Komagataeibacter rhaeticus TaxID=215221 RepID=A0A858JM09_9PROT|nr:hypothetical protein GWK63_04405 [Komagataeibacter rhaeticus]QOC47359.1 hypothetical protein ICJ78_04405 [Komagataeibacter rhaeticus]
MHDGLQGHICPSVELPMPEQFRIPAGFHGSLPGRMAQGGRLTRGAGSDHQHQRELLCRHDIIVDDFDNAAGRHSRIAPVRFR